ncbi:MAG: hypothetical protein KDB28_09290, partial [Tetrasphaera sp.]|nr:hypothetical protein [Tetrasphaera sp.]
TSLHYYFPWAMKALAKWSAFCVATDRIAKTQVDTEPWFAVADNDQLDYDAKIVAYQRLADAHFDTERYNEFCATTLSHIDEITYEYVTSPEFRSMLTSTIHQTYPTHEWERFEAHFGGLLTMWSDDNAHLAG